MLISVSYDPVVTLIHIFIVVASSLFTIRMVVVPFPEQLKLLKAKKATKQVVVASLAKMLFFLFNSVAGALLGRYAVIVWLICWILYLVLKYIKTYREAN